MVESERSLTEVPLPTPKQFEERDDERPRPHIRSTLGEVDDPAESTQRVCDLKPHEPLISACLLQHKLKDTHNRDIVELNDKPLSVPSIWTR